MLGELCEWVACSRALGATKERHLGMLNKGTRWMFANWWLLSFLVPEGVAKGREKVVYKYQET